jgi:hypothetical protein
MNQIEFSAVLEPASAQGETGLLLIRLYQSLSHSRAVILNGLIIL